MHSDVQEIHNQIAKVCDQFEEQWSEHAPQTIREHLARFAPEHRERLLRELILIDHEHCEEAGFSIVLSDYYQYFPDCSRVIDQLLFDLQTADGKQDSSLKAGLELLLESGTASSGASPRSGIATLPPPSLQLDERVGTYVLDQMLGEGSMGVVYRATHSELGRAVALKFVSVSSSEAVARFQTEARTIAGLSHPNIVQIYEVGEHQGRPFLALELMSGGTLDDRLRQHVLSPRRSAEVVASLANAVSAAHACGVIHRDLKPANVLLDDQENPKLADFGLARNLNLDGHTLPGTLLGTPGYMSPEQTTGDPVHTSVDVYGLGAILYACLTGQPPFRGRNIPDTLSLVREQEPISVRALEPSVPIDLESICLKCLQKHPESRYPSAAALAADLHSFLGGRPVIARPVSRLRKLGRWCQRNPAVAALSAVLIVTAVAGVAGIFVQWQRAEQNAVRFQNEFLRAEAEAATATAVNEFMRDVFAAAQPSKLGRNVTVREAIDAAVENVDEALDAHPLVEAAVRSEIGVTYRRLGELERAIEQLRIALELYRVHLGPTQLKTIDVADALAGALRSFEGDQEWQEAIQLRNLVLEERSRQLGDNHPDTIAAMNNLATVYLDTGDIDKAKELYQRALKRIGIHPESNPQDAIPLRFNLATIYRDRGDYAFAEQEVRNVIDNLTDNGAITGDDAPDVLNARNTLAGIVLLAGRPDEAESLYRDVLKHRQKTLGKDHVYTLSTQRKLTRMLIDCGKYAEALPLLQSCLETHNQAVGPGAGLTFGVRKSLITALEGLNQPEEARAVLQETVQILSETRGPDHEYTQEAQKMLDRLTSP